MRLCLWVVNGFRWPRVHFLFCFWRCRRSYRPFFLVRPQLFLTLWRWSSLLGLQDTIPFLFFNLCRLSVVGTMMTVPWLVYWRVLFSGFLFWILFLRCLFLSWQCIDCIVDRFWLNFSNWDLLIYTSWDGLWWFCYHFRGGLWWFCRVLMKIWITIFINRLSISRVGIAVNFGLKNCHILWSLVRCLL